MLHYVGTLSATPGQVACRATSVAAEDVVSTWADTNCLRCLASVRGLQVVNPLDVAIKATVIGTGSRVALEWVDTDGTDSGREILTWARFEESWQLP